MYKEQVLRLQSILLDTLIWSSRIQNKGTILNKGAVHHKGATDHEAAEAFKYNENPLASSLHLLEHSVVAHFSLAHFIAPAT